MVLTGGSNLHTSWNDWVSFKHQPTSIHTHSIYLFNSFKCFLTRWGISESILMVSFTALSPTKLSREGADWTLNIIENIVRYICSLYLSSWWPHWGCPRGGGRGGSWAAGGPPSCRRWGRRPGPGARPGQGTPPPRPGPAAAQPGRAPAAPGSSPRISWLTLLTIFIMITVTTVATTRVELYRGTSTWRILRWGWRSQQTTDTFLVRLQMSNQQNKKYSIALHMILSTCVGFS